MALGSRWPTRYGMAAPSAWPAAVSFVMCLVVCATTAAIGGRHEHLGLGALAVGVALCSWGVRPLQLAAITAIAWLFENGFLSGHLGDLHWRGITDLRVSGLLLGCACLGAALGACLGDRPSRIPAPRRIGELRHG